MTTPAKIEPPRPSAVDVLHTALRAALGSVPVVGAAAVELFALVVATPLEKRRHRWMEEVATRLVELGQKGCLRVEELGSNDAFLDSVMQATQAALRTNQGEKLRALRNAVLHTALGAGPNEIYQQIFLNFVDSFTASHLRMLRGPGR